MSIQSEITRINTNIASAYTACNDKGATMPDAQNSANLADTIESIPTGGGGANSHTISYYDIDGTLLYEDTVTSGSTYTIPASYTANYDSTYLDFQGWTGQQLRSVTSGTVLDTSVNDLYHVFEGRIYRDYSLGAVYTNKTCYKGVLKVNVPSNNYVAEFSEGFQRSYFSNTTYYPGSYDLVVDWGDGTSNTRVTKAEVLASTASGNVVDYYPFTHTYSISGNYVIQFWFEADNKNVTEYDYGATLPSYYYFSDSHRIHLCPISSRTAEIITHWYNPFGSPTSTNCYFGNSQYMSSNTYNLKNLKVYNNTRDAFFRKNGYSVSNGFCFILDNACEGNSSVNRTPELKCLVAFQSQINIGLSTYINYATKLERVLVSNNTHASPQFQSCPRLRESFDWTRSDDDLSQLSVGYNAPVPIERIKATNCPLVKTNPHDQQKAPLAYYSNDTQTLYLDPENFPVVVNNLSSYYKISGNFVNPVYGGHENLPQSYNLQDVLVKGGSLYAETSSNLVNISNIPNLTELTVSHSGTYVAGASNLPSLHTLSITQPNATAWYSTCLRDLPPAIDTLDVSGCTSMTVFNPSTSSSYGIAGSYFKTIKLPSSCTTVGASGNSYGVFYQLKSSEIDMSYFNDNMTYYTKGLFYDCSNLLKVTFKSTGTIASGQPGSGTASTSEYVFYGDRSLLEVEIPSWFLSMGGGWFQQCSYLKKIWIPSTVTTIGSGTSIGYYPFYGYSPNDSSNPCRIFTDATAPLSGWGTYWNAYGYNYSSSNVLPVTYGATIEEYRNA